MAKKKSDADGPWLSPKEALEIATKSLGDIAARVIRDRLRAGQLPAIALLTSDSQDGNEPEIDEEPLPIPANFWSRIQDETVFWKAGDARFYFPDGIYGTRIVHCSGIRFLAKTIEDMFPIPNEQLFSHPPLPSEVISSGAKTNIEIAVPKSDGSGRPRKPYWDELWIEMCRQIYDGDLAADGIRVQKIADAMMDWSSLKYPDDALSESAAKRAARRLAEALKGGS